MHPIQAPIKITNYLLIPTSLIATPVLAMTQCPPEFSEKEPLVNSIGWCVLGLGIVLGLMIMRYAHIFSRGRRLSIQIMVLLAGMVGMLTTWLAGLRFSFSFFLAC